MNKKVIRLTESKLKQMITEAVQETLYETGLDPRTLASAARKAEERGERRDNIGRHSKRSQKFLKGAHDAWNERYATDTIKMGGTKPYELGNFRSRPQQPSDIHGLDGYELEELMDDKDGKFGTRYSYTFKRDGSTGADAQAYPNVKLGYYTHEYEPDYGLDDGYETYHPNKNDIEYKRYIDSVDRMAGHNINFDKAYADEEYEKIQSKLKNRFKKKISPEGLEVARQMASGTGKYNREKGRWQ